MNITTENTSFFEVTERTIDNYLIEHEKELARNDYEVLKGKRLTDYKLVDQDTFGDEKDFVTKTEDFSEEVKLELLIAISNHEKE